INRIISELELIKSLFFESFLFMFKKICSFSVPSEIKQTFRSVDEYVTLLMLEVINKVFEENKDKIDPFKVRLYKLADDIYNYRKTQGYIYPNEENQKEYFLHYRGLLKKFISSCLFLNCEPAFNLYLHIASSIGSAVAMLFAIIVMIYAQIKYSITSAIFIVTAVISYVFKDRIKEFVKILFIKKTGGFIYDRKIKIKEPTHNFSIGYIKESFFISNINSIDEDIIKERKRNYLFIYEDVLNETVLKYKKVVKLEPKKIISYHKRRRNLVDIMRFSIYDFIKHADDEVINYPTYYGNNFKEEKLFKNYVINIIVRYFYDKKDKIYERYKIVFNRSGIINVDKY
ncbi:MAG: hypothetical protein N2446_00175, partial [Elusimicrobiales bacterium]|nr:hypothetical protein [Elusimicrobiales bacterium]